MTLTIKDIVYILAYIITIISGFVTFRARLKILETEMINNRKIIFGERGCLNLIDAKTCNEYRNQVFIAIKRSEKAMESTTSKLDRLNDHLIKIMTKLEISQDEGKK